MQIALDPTRDGGAMLLDRLYHFNPNEIPADGEMAIVVTPRGELLARAVWDADSTKRTAMMPEDGPGREIVGRLRVALVGKVTRSFAYSESQGFPMSALTAQGITRAANEGIGLRERVRASIMEAAERGGHSTTVRLREIALQDADTLTEDLVLAGFSVKPTFPPASKEVLISWV